MIKKIMVITLLSASTFVTSMQAEDKIDVIEKQILEKFYYENEPVNPRIIQALNGWISDSGDEIVAISLSGSQKSNRFFCENDVAVRQVKNNRTMVSLDFKDREWFAYIYIGQTTSGILILRTLESTGGSGVFNHVMLLKLNKEKNMIYDEKNQILKKGDERLVLKKLGGFSLSDRWDGTLQAEGNKLIITKEGDVSAELGIKEKRVIRIDF